MTKRISLEKLRKFREDMKRRKIINPSARGGDEVVSFVGGERDEVVKSKCGGATQRIHCNIIDHIDEDIGKLKYSLSLSPNCQELHIYQSQQDIKLGLELTPVFEGKDYKSLKKIRLCRLLIKKDLVISILKSCPSLEELSFESCEYNIIGDVIDGKEMLLFQKIRILNLSGFSMQSDSFEKINQLFPNLEELKTGHFFKDHSRGNTRNDISKEISKFEKLKKLTLGLGVDVANLKGLKLDKLNVNIGQISEVDGERTLKELKINNPNIKEIILTDPISRFQVTQHPETKPDRASAHTLQKYDNSHNWP